jgi:hypothetical protein
MVEGVNGAARGAPSQVYSIGMIEILRP